MMRRYETVFIINPDATVEERQTILDRVNSEIEKYQGVLLQFDEWGLRKTAYLVNKKPRGYYVMADYCGNDGMMISEIERFFRIDDNVNKYMTVQVAAEVDPEAAKAELIEIASRKPIALEDLHEARRAPRNINVAGAEEETAVEESDTNDTLENFEEADAVADGEDE